MTNVFPILFDAKKLGTDPMTLRSNVELKDVLTFVSEESDNLAQRLVRENLEAFGKGMSLLSSDKKGIVHYIQNSWSEISSIKSSIVEGKDEAKRQMDSLLGLTMHLLDRSHSHYQEENLSMQENLHESERQLVHRLRAEIHSNYRNLQSFGKFEINFDDCNECGTGTTFNDHPTRVLSTADDIERTINALDGHIVTLQEFAILSYGTSCTYAGWLKKSSSFSFGDKNMFVHRYWGLLVQDTIYFLPQPYAKKVAAEIKLEKTYKVTDPDENLESSTKTSLSTRLLIVSSTVEGTMMLDCDSFDEKIMWKDALRPWLVVSENTPRGKGKNKSRLSILRGPSSTGLFSDNTTNESSGGEADSRSSLASANSREAVLGESTGNRSTSKFRAATKGMLAAISLSRKTVSSTITSIQHKERRPSSATARSSPSQVEKIDEVDDETEGRVSDVIAAGSMTSIASIISQSNLNIAEMIETLEDIRSSLKTFSNQMKNIRETHLEQFRDTKKLVDTMRDSFLAMFLGLSILHTIEDEVEFDINTSV